MNNFKEDKKLLRESLVDNVEKEQEMILSESLSLRVCWLLICSCLVWIPLHLLLLESHRKPLHVWVQPTQHPLDSWCPEGTFCCCLVEELGLSHIILGPALKSKPRLKISLSVPKVKKWTCLLKTTTSTNNPKPMSSLWPNFIPISNS